MEIIFEYVMDHWIFIVSLVVEVIIGVLLLFKRGKCNEPLLSVIGILPRLVIYAENKYGASRGAEKKNYVLRTALDVFKKLTGIEVTESSEIYHRISYAIEEILKTPMKKEDK